MRTSVTRARRDRVAPFKEGRSDVIVPVLDDGVPRVRLARVRTSLGLLDGEPFLQEDCIYLDGLTVRTLVRRGDATVERIDMGTAAVPARSKDVTDFGRMEHAAGILIAQVQTYGTKRRPSPEELEALLRSYQGILEWRRKAREKMAAAEGHIDMAEAMMRAVLAL